MQRGLNALFGSLAALVEEAEHGCQAALAALDVVSQLGKIATNCITLKRDKVDYEIPHNTWVTIPR